jgi:PKD repeat protein
MWNDSSTTTRVIIVVAIAAVVSGLILLCVVGLGLLGLFQLPGAVTPTPVMASAEVSAVISGPPQGQVGQPVAFSARNSRVPPGSQLTRLEWTFGDGTGATGFDVTHIYTNSGDYRVILTVTDDKGRSDTAVQPIGIPPAPLTPNTPAEGPNAVISAPSEGLVGQPITFDASQSTGPNPLVNYSWELGDGSTANAVVVQKIYNAVGVYSVTLMVADDQGLQDQATHQITIVEPMVPGVTPTIPPSEATMPVPAMTPTVPAPEATIPVPEATAPAPEMTPTVASGGGQAPTAAIIGIVSKGAAQAVFLAGETIVVESGYPVEFDGSSSQPGSSDIVNYNWTFGDGAGTATGPVVSFTYNAPGVYTASLTVTDTNGASDTTTAEVQVYVE